MANVRFLKSRVWKWTLMIGGFLLLLAVLSYLININYLRQYAERRMNQNLTDYTVSVGKAFFHPIGMSLTLEDLVLIQNENPEPPVANIQRLHASIHWVAIIKGRLVGDFLIDRPKLYINLKQVKKEAQSEIPLARKGWQDALLAVYPLKIDVFKVNNGELTYIDVGPNPPLQASDIFLHATNIRNIFTPDNTYPSPVIASATIFDQGHLHLDGHANFLQKPRIGFKGKADLGDIDLGYFKPIMHRQNMAIRQGTLSATGKMEFAAKKSVIHLKTIELTGLDADYDLRPETEAKQQQQIQQATKAAREMSNAPAAIIRVDLVKITKGTLGYFNQTTDPKIRIYADHIDATVKDFSNQLAEGSSAFQMHGRFLGSGATEITGTIRPESKSPNLNLKIAIENTDMKAMSDIFQAYGKFDIKKGEFSFFSEMTIQNFEVHGYVKPIFKNMEVSDMRSAEEKSIFHTLYVGTVKVVAELLKNRPRQQVATETDISGPVGDPDTSILQIIVNLIRNAFFQAILPGFEEEVNQQQQSQ